ncbi:MAG: hypothetical protein BYD32DRAFT_434406 [Podila humilis]|nr:MAG: hypothetical protein BYD32DRAFT_434406 [Podila humilis]
MSVLADLECAGTLVIATGLSAGHVEGRAVKFWEYSAGWWCRVQSGCVPDPGVVEVGEEISLNRSDAVFDAIVGDGADRGDVGDDGDDNTNVGRAQENDEKESDSGDRDGSWSESLEGCENEDGVQGRGLERMEVGDGGGGGGVEKEVVTEGDGLEDKEEDEEDEEEEEEEEEEVEVEKEGRNGEKEEGEEGEGEGQDEEIGVDMLATNYFRLNERRRRVSHMGC